MMKNTKRVEERSLNYKNSKAKKVITIIMAIIVLFGIYNLAWLGWRNLRYRPYTEGLDIFIENKSYVYRAEDSFLYNVKFPDYLTYTGNLCVSVPDGKCALLIWPKVVGGYTYGVQIQVDEEIYSIMLDKDFSAEDSQFDEILNEYSKTISELHEKADSMWDIEK